MPQNASVVGLDVSGKRIDACVLPSDVELSVANDAAGCATLLQWLLDLEVGEAVIEASGGCERAVVSQLRRAGLRVRIVDPKRIRDFAKALGQRAKNDRIDARVIARFGVVVSGAATPDDPDRQALAELVAARQDLVGSQSRLGNQRSHAQGSAAGSLDRVLKAIGREIAQLERLIERTIEATPAFAARAALIGSAPGAGVVLVGALIAWLPELAQLQRRSLAALVGVAPYDDDSGRLKGDRHIAGGRVMLGVGPGSLPTDGIMVGIEQSQTRGLLEDGLAAMMKLLTGDEPVTLKNERWDLRDARLHLRPYSNPLFDVAVAAVASPTGAKLAGRHGIGMLSVGATTAAGFDMLALHWDVLTAEAKAHGKAVDRSKWWLVGLYHIAETKEQAYRDVGYGIEHWFRYFQQVAAFPQMAVAGNSVGEMIEFINSSGLGAIGTPEACAAQITRLWQQSNGGFGAYLTLAHNWANPQATLRGYELIAREVMPQFQGHARATLDAARRAKEAREALAAAQSEAVEAARSRYQEEVAKRH